MDNNKYTDEQLKRVLAKILPDVVATYSTGLSGGEVDDKDIRQLESEDWCLAWRKPLRQVLDTELLYLCDLLEQSLDEQQELKYDPKLYDLCYYKGIPQYRAPWQDRVIAAAEARNIIID